MPSQGRVPRRCLDGFRSLPVQRIEKIENVLAYPFLSTFYLHCDLWGSLYTCFLIREKYFFFKSRSKKFKGILTTCHKEVEACALTAQHGSVLSVGFSQRIMVPCKQIENSLKRLSQILGFRGSSISPFSCLSVSNTTVLQSRAF